MKILTTRKTGNIAPFGLRLQPELKKELEEAARLSGRSLNAEIAHRLEKSFTEGWKQSFEISLLADEKTQIADMQKVISVIKASYSKDPDLHYVVDFKSPGNK